jgi:sec-independent protein translocase protein TatC
MMTDISQYLDFILLLFLAFGVAFEVPVAVVLLVATGIVKVESLKKNRGYMILAIFIVAAILTPPDAVSQTFMALPMYALLRVRHPVRPVRAEEPRRCEARVRGHVKESTRDHKRRESAR